MKFTDGQWLLQPGVVAHYATETYAVDVRPDQVVLLVTTRPIKHRGDTLTGPTLTVTLQSPAPGVIRVSAVHYVAGQEKRLHVPMPGASAQSLQVTETDRQLSITSGALTVDVKKGEGYGLVFREGDRVLTRSDGRALGYLQTASKTSYMHEQLSLGVGEYVYGLGERFTPWVKNGQVVENTNKDGGTACEQAYKSVPFYLSSRGYGVLVNEAGPVSFEVASEKTSRVQFSREGESLDYCVVAGPTPKDVVKRLTALTGRAPLPPAWSFGLWMTTSFTTQYDEATATHFIDEMARRELPLSVFHFDCFWMREFQWCDFEWDRRGFPDPEGMLARLKAKGLRISLWINPYVAQRSSLFEIGQREGYFLKRPDGRVWQTDLWQPGMAIVDFTNPAAVAWYQSHLRRLLAMGVDCFKTDFGERIPDQDVCYFDGSDPVEMHNLYALHYNEVVFKLLQEVKQDEAVVFARSTYASGQRFPVHWGGDCWSNFESMAESLRGGLSLSSCGFAYWSHDIGGFEGNPPPAVYKRWIQFGLLSSHSRLHGSSSYRVPWLVDEESCDVLRHFTRLKHQLMPYLYASAAESSATGVPMMRSAVLQHPDDPACATLDRQYHLGDSLLVAPVFTDSGEVDVYLPAGRWTHLLSGEVVEGGRWRREQHDFLSLPLYVAPNTVLPWGAETEKPDYDYAQGVVLRVFALDEGHRARFVVPTLDGGVAARGHIEREGDSYRTVITEGALAQWQVEVNGKRSGVQSSADRLDWTP
ncbi:alpha-xylosidase [Roseateles terrae]|uniref:Alpha-D-xyloside xylohydrolase n=1 Tax=Roseateles terrae TaxID=431060 RepID=A0ABR6GMD9_9BURK|nr:alpha-xylosidase [Roseateles terrae]MBB3193237.1 alpha-D-xyloside xylohydrolase [Roseateles terrae]OWQ89551.1 alpha-xylosidase [Roseateles terrae]